ncbi:MAG: AMP-binding protein [Firmicutes bacterium]|nr:AMP-binding protein [Bacillota bacterium]HPU01910.1 AMP-binding protein [Bacillota bacterium]
MVHPSTPTGAPEQCRCGRPLYGPLAESLLPRIRRAAEGPHGITFVGSAAGGPDVPPVRVSWKQLHREACAAAAALQARGVAPGDHVALLGPTSRALVTTVQAIWLAGGCMIMLPIPLRFASVDDFMRQTRALLKSGQVSLLLVDPEMAAFYEPAPGDPPVLSLNEIQPGSPGVPAADDYRPVPDDPCRLAVLQFTSGSTAEPKGVMLPHHVIGANIDGMVEAAEVTMDDTIVSWLPLYHDMGLIGMLTVSMALGCSLVLASPLDFTRRPGDWMRWMDEYRGTITAGPNFSWVLATRALKRMNETGEKLDLSLIRIALNGAEPVDPDAVENFIEAARPHGFRPGAVFCAFGMAEVSIGGTFPPPMRGMACDAVDREALEREGIARPAHPGLPTTRRLPLLGRPVPGLEMRICDPATGEPREVRQVGELEIKGTSVTPGYYGRPDLTAQLFRGEWLRTGDLAYFVEGPEEERELVICGRIKDVIIIAGRNIYPEDIERAVGMIEGVRAGNVIAFGVEGARGKEAIVIVAEVRGAASLEELRRAIRRRVIEVCEVPPRDIVLVQPGTLPKTSSGKLQRSLCRKQYLGKELIPVE